MNKNLFETKLKPLLQYIGTIGAVSMSIAYVITVFILIKGFRVNAFINIGIFALVNAVVGFIIMQFLKIQGIAFAKNLPENQKVLTEYYNTKTHDKKAHSIKFYWVISVIRDLIEKALSVGVATFGLIYIVVEGCNDYNLLWLALVNLILFTCFGFLSLNSAYDFFNERHIPFIKEQLEKGKAKNSSSLEMAEKELDKQRDDMVHTDRRDNLLDTCLDTCNTSTDNLSVVVDDGECSDCVLGGTIYSSSTTTNSTNIVNKEIVQ